MGSRLNLQRWRDYFEGLSQVPDPGAGNDLAFSNIGSAIFRIATAGAESRLLPDPSGYGVGTRLLVILETDGGNLTVTDGTSPVVLEDAGDAVEFIVSVADNVKVWKLRVDDVDVPPIDLGDILDLDEAPVALGAAVIDTGDDPTDAALVAMADALQTLGLVTHSWVAANDV